MGDRANICMHEEQGGEIYLYAHWDGMDLAHKLQKALVRGRDRWSDESYLARIVFCEIVRDDLDDLTGYGISTTLTDNDSGNPIIHVHVQDQAVEIGEHRWSFEEYTKLDLAAVLEEITDD